MPHELWKQAKAAHPDDDQARQGAYFRLMVKHGHVISMDEMLTKEERAELTADLQRMAALRNPCWHREPGSEPLHG